MSTQTEPLQDQVFDPNFTKKFTPRGDSFSKLGFRVEVYAVGETVEKALNALGNACDWKKITDIKFQEVDVPCDWYVRFYADGTSMKASGQYLTGGVIVTWWK